jgi:hypothetical protein
LLQLLLLSGGVLLKIVDLLRVGLGRRLGAAAYHVRCLGARLEAGDCKGDHPRFLLPEFALAGGHLLDLRHDRRPSLDAGTAVKVQLETSVDVPLDPLAEPALTKPVAHFEANDFMLRLHQKVEDRLCRVLDFVVKHMALHHVLSVGPSLGLTAFLLEHKFLGQVVSVSRELELNIVHLAVAGSTGQLLLLLLKLQIAVASVEQVALGQRVGDR